MDDIIQLKAFIKDSKPAIWRRLRVKKQTTLFELHHILQIAFGWQNYHAYEFHHQNYVFGQPEFFESYEDENIIDVKSITLESLFVEKGEHVKYVYDFGDNWIHYAVVERFLPAETEKQYPCCMSGKNSSPPEDCGGLRGYYYMLKVLKDHQHPEYSETKQWIGKNFSSTAFNMAEVNAQLKNLDRYIKKWLKGF